MASRKFRPEAAAAAAKGSFFNKNLDLSLCKKMRTRKARPKKKVAKKIFNKHKEEGGGEKSKGKALEKNCYKWQLATPFGSRKKTRKANT